MSELIKEFWGIIMAAVGAAVWLIRLEGRVSMNAAVIQRMEKQRVSDLNEVSRRREETNKELRDLRSEIHKMGSEVSEMHGEIKVFMRGK